ncbi:carboxypeptidase-like regulatory domain-containing protein [Blastopirellula sp. J2-11]|uniref:carboxypeptidase-like regulatory domain-containing protein n=1 Tax=Blastopirellula sp. J2-11 TaxID=2943192 RepID=UPI0021C7B124|nr:carboxypeptidase-like regulatory domain-containing protein [Blastopirellula sp. J2-11]UUO09031.1 carboxypeptidase-like regulatory domain-containing protein [Blastopirellula sp. J2-11]
MNHVLKMFCGACLAGMMIGCTGGDLKSVAGMVTIDGQPAAGVKVIFVPLEGGRANSLARTDEEGRYTLAYTSQHAGAKPGAYKVLVTQEEMNTGRELIPPRYSSGGKTDLRAEVIEGGENVFNFEIESK